MQLVWLRRDLRLEDNTALIKAVEESNRTGQPLCAVFVATPEQWKQHHMSESQAELIWRRLRVIAQELEKHNIPLLYRECECFNDAVNVIDTLVSTLSVEALHFNKEYELNEVNRDRLIVNRLHERGVQCLEYDDKCLLAPGSVVNKQGQYFKVFTPFKNAYLKQFYQSPTWAQKLPKLDNALNENVPRDWLLTENSVFSYPTSVKSELSVETADILGALRTFCRDRVDRYDDDRDFPSIDGTSGLSSYLAIGALSVRQCVSRLHVDHVELSSGRSVWLSELVWRDFYQHLLHFEPKLSRGESFASWGRHLAWETNSSLFERWCQGNTGYPIVDAAMRQLNQTGWMHNRLRMITASFLVKDLQLDWRLGEDYFMSKLTDGDYAANNGGWQWCASTGCDGQPYFRIFNPTSQGEKFDADGRFVRKWIPELKQVADKFVHQPWKSPNAKFLEYPSPIVDHKLAREKTLERYKKAKNQLVESE